MYTILQVSLNFFALVILLAILLDIRNQDELGSGRQRRYVRLIYATMLVMILEAIAWVVDKQPGKVYRFLNIYVNVAYYIADSLPAYLWVVYLNFQVYGESVKARRLNIALLFPAIINIILSLLTPFNGWMFYVDSANVYHRADHFYFLVVILVFYLAYSIITILANGSKLKRRTYYMLLLFNVPPLVGGAVQALLYGMPSMWTGVTLMLMFIYFNIQNARLSADYLTGISNRRDIDSYLALLIKDVSSGPSFSGIFMDIDDFKNINDRYGHIVGDEALRVTADLLKRSMRKDDFIARFGGDEFIIIAPRLEKEAELKITAQRIIMNFDEYNRIGTLPFDLILSMGYAVYKKGSGLTPAQFIKKLDDLMYENKRILGKL